MHSNSNAQRGFTLMELMFTITVLGILLGLAVPNFLADRCAITGSSPEQRIRRRAQPRS
jgi:prepilin-type N-terminal cleavage/methylation domain-containing protein